MANAVNILDVMIEGESLSPFEVIEAEMISHIPELDALKDTLSSAITSKEHALSVLTEAYMVLSIMATSVQVLKDAVILQE